MNYAFDLEWEIVPLGGGTGQAYKGVKDNQHAFIKRNTTPFLAAVSIEGIAPKLLWTRRTAHGEHITAQEWIDGQCLKPYQMIEYDVMELIKTVHTSDNLKKTLSKIQDTAKTTQQLLDDYYNGLHWELKSNTFLNKVYHYLIQLSDELSRVNSVVCHGDLSHHNFLVDKTNRLYLVDWENVTLADPMLDIAMILTQYVAFSDWQTWLETYGITLTKETISRLQWYSVYMCLMHIKKSHFNGHNHQVNYYIMLIKQIVN